MDVYASVDTVKLTKTQCDNDNDNDFLTEWHESDKDIYIWGDEMRMIIITKMSEEI